MDIEPDLDTTGLQENTGKQALSIFKKFGAYKRIIEVWIISTFMYYSIYNATKNEDMLAEYIDERFDIELEDWHNMVILALPVLFLFLGAALKMARLHLLAMFFVIMPGFGAVTLTQEVLLNKLTKEKEKYTEDSWSYDY